MHGSIQNHLLSINLKAQKGRGGDGDNRQNGYWAKHLRFDDLSNEMFKRGALISGDPTFYNLMGQNYQKTCQYEDAKACYIKSYNIAPNRFYPLYLLIKLYSDESYYHKKEIEEIGTVFLNKKIKVESESISRMQKEVKSIISNL